MDSIETLIRKSEVDSQKAMLLLTLSDALDCSEVATKKKYTDEAMQLSETSTWEKGRMLTFMCRGRLYENCIKNYRQALNQYFQGVRIANNLDDRVSGSRIYSSIGQIYSFINKYDSALFYFRLSLSLSPNATDQIGIYGNRGIVYDNIGDYLRALESYEQALKLIDSILASPHRTMNDSITRGGLLITIGDVHLSMSQYNNALKNYTAALELTKNLHNDYLEIWALTGIGKVYKCTQEFQKSIQFFQKGLTASDSSNGHPFKSFILNEIGIVYCETNDLTKALSCAEQSVKSTEESDNQHQMSKQQQLSKTYTTLGKIYTKMKDNDNAMAYLQKALKICEQTGALDDEKEAWAALTTVYEQTHQTDKAFDAYRHFITLRDSVFSIEKAKEMVRIDLQSEFDRKQLTDSIKQQDAKKEFKLELQKQRAYTYGGFAGLFLVLMLSFFIYRNYSQQKKANKIISKANATIQKEKQVSETLLLNILPGDVAQELKDAGKVHAKLYDHVTVLFTDFVNFTEAGGRLTPQQLVAELDTCFQAFDEIIGKYNIEKIKTVGDAYLAVSGLPQANPDHASDMVSAAIEMRDFMIKRKQELGDMTFGMRIGINSGYVVAGIVGIKKFAYDIWGDTVNIAARMEQNSEPGKINISESTYVLLKGNFNCQYRGKIQAKNKGVIDMYFVS